MATEYPNSIDVFNEPTTPESTPLSEAGVGGNTRNHYMHHRDLGDAVQALETYASLKDHDHSGNGTTAHGNKLVQANTHESSDTDSSTSAIHHTLGPLPNQAAPGDHLHDYNTLINCPVVRCTSTTRPTNATLGLQVYEVDTNRVRVWSQFTQNNITNTGILGTDDFERFNQLSLGDDWLQVYTFNNRGLMATPDGHTASWIDDGNDPNRCIARRIKSSDAHTLTDNQIITWQTGGTPIESHFAWVTTSASNDMYFRMSDDGTNYTRVCFTYDQWNRGSVIMYGTVSGPQGERKIGTLSADISNPNDLQSYTWTYWTAEFIGNTLSVYNGSMFLGKIVDVNNLSPKGSYARGWGIGMEAGDRGGIDGLISHQVTPSNIANVTIKDASFYTGSPIWQLLPVGAIPSCRLLQSSNQKISSNGTTIEWNTELEDNFNFFDINSSRTNIVMKEAGLYSVEATVQWDVENVPDVAHLVFATNGVESTVRTSEYLRGNMFKPGFSQTMYCSGKMRFAQNDVLTLKAYYTVSNSILDRIFSYWDKDSQINSRIEISFLGP